MTSVIKLVLDCGVRDLCRQAYPNRPRGCPNYGKRDACPPQAPLIGDVLDLSEGVWAVWVEFDLAAHRERMQEKHPNWSRRQLDCCLYWQGGVKTQLRHEVTSLCTMMCLSYPETKWTALYIPEAMGVNVTETMRGIGVELEWPPERIVRKVAIIGHEKKGDT